MGIEIERKFLVHGDAWRGPETGLLCRQGYVCGDPARIVRVRIMGDNAFLTLKGPAKGLLRPEFEYEIPLADAEYMLDNLVETSIIEKVRHRVRTQDALWEVDEFLGHNAGLILAEIELQRPDQTFILPPWAGPEVTDDPRYSNAFLARHPFRAWPGQAARERSAAVSFFRNRDLQNP